MKLTQKKQVKKPYKSLIGKKFGRLTVVSLVESDVGTKIPTKWLCKCDCGNTIKALGYNLNNGNTKSCGCLRKEFAKNKKYIHGCTKTRLHTTWSHMKQRCENTNDKAFKHYGGRGIKICDEWHDFACFRDWALVNGYSDDLTIDRIDVNGNYEPSNCRWVTLKEQQTNKRNNAFIIFDGKRKCLAEWAKEFGCRQSSVHRVILEKEGRISYGSEQ